MTSISAGNGHDPGYGLEHQSGSAMDIEPRPNAGTRGDIDALSGDFLPNGHDQRDTDGQGRPDQTQTPHLDLGTPVQPTVGGQSRRDAHAAPPNQDLPMPDKVNAATGEEPSAPSAIAQTQLRDSLATEASAATVLHPPLVPGNDSSAPDEQSTQVDGTSNNRPQTPSSKAAAPVPRQDAPMEAPVAIPPHTPLNQIRPTHGADASHLAMVPGGHSTSDALGLAGNLSSHALQQHLTQQPDGGSQLDGWRPTFPNDDYHNLRESMAGVIEDPTGFFRSMANMRGPAQSSAMSHPSVVTPAQVTLPNSFEENLHNLTPSNTVPANTLLQAGNHGALESFARIEFPDSVFQMTTYAVVIGRDQRALEQARRDEKRAEEHRRLVEERERLGLPAPEPMVQDRSKFSKSYISEEGGMLGPESDNEDNPRPSKRQRIAKPESAGSSQNENEERRGNVISNRQYVSHTPGAAAVDLAALRPSPWHVPFLGIHSSGPDMIAKTKAISREHLKVKYNEDEGVFEALPLHTNGFFCQDVLCQQGRVVLRSGDRLQIKDISFRFIINGVSRGSTGNEKADRTFGKKKHSQGGKEMSFDFEGSHGDQEMQDTSDELSEMAESPQAPSDMGLYQDEESYDPSPFHALTEPHAQAQDPTQSMVLDPSALPDALAVLNPEDAQLLMAGMPMIPKKRGPGRPPKNGIMSKREQRLLKKQQQELAKKTLPPMPPAEPPVKRKVGRPRKHPLPEDMGDRPEKRKYTPRKPKEEGGEGSDAERQAREAKERKARAKSPPLHLNKADYTEDQLMKPTRNYGVLIDEVLTEAGDDGLSLKQIYKRLCQRYPYFYFFPETKGWESSVRHNLLGNKAFQKLPGGVWTRVPGIELDAGKKRKTSPPRRMSSGPTYGTYPYPPFNNAQPMAPGGPGYPATQNPGGFHTPGFIPQQNQAALQVQQQHFASPSSHAPGQPSQPVAPATSRPPMPVAAPVQVLGYPAEPQAVPNSTPFNVPHSQQPGPHHPNHAARPPSVPAGPIVKAEDGSAVPQIASAPQSIAPFPPRATPSAGPSTSQRATPVPHNGPSATPPVGNPARPVIEPRLLGAVVGLKNGLIDNLAKAANPRAEAIVMSALNRCIGLKTEATENDKMEAICIKGIRQVIDGSIKAKSPTPGGNNVAGGLPPIFGEKVLETINGFKNVSVKALKPKIGDMRAEAVALSAIDRVLGLADKSIVPKPAEGDPTANLEGVEQHMMKSIRQLLVGMNQKLHGST